MPRSAPLSAALLLALAPVAGAEGLTAPGGAEVCVSERIEAGAPVAECVNAAQAACLDLAEAAPLAALQCFLAAREQWGARIAARIEALEAEAPAEIAAIARVEAKYDLLLNGVQCERMNELVLLREPPSDAVRLRKARCDATATGLAYVKLLAQSRGLP